MFKVFFADDEIIVRDGIRSCLADQPGFTLAGEAQDGEMALSMIHEIKPDILITDIKMPFMDGLELCRIVRKIQPWIRIIILSGHDEFEYAKQAISIGIDDYLLKPFTAEELIEALKKAGARIEAENKKEEDIAKLKAQVESQTEIAKDRFLSDFAQGHIALSDFVQGAETYGLKVLSRFYTMLLIKTEQNGIKSFGETELFAIKSFVKNLFEQESGSGKSSDTDALVFLSAKDELCLMVKTSTKEGAEEAVFAATDAVKHQLFKQGIKVAGIGIGLTVERLAALSESFGEAKKALQMAVQNGGGKLISAVDLQSENPETLLNLSGGEFVDKLKYALVEEIDQIIAKQIELLGNNPFQFTVMGSYLIIELISACSRIIEQLGGKVEDVCPEILTSNFVSGAVKSVEDFSSQSRFMLNKVLRYRDSKMNSRYGDMIMKAKRYIDENYNDQDICLRLVAEAVAVSPNHFSAVFSQECGQSFIEYLTAVRIEHAKSLLAKSEMKSTDIAYEVGFNDPHYFSFIFKKNTGLSPKEYRSNTQNSSQIEGEND